ncbi:TPA: LPXTG cell wall anchor domain-containing protein [Staphylococcus delphini]|nr:LPXTG cell wall anchor domain-containing protein [Staphylococcus delphini]
MAHSMHSATRSSHSVQSNSSSSIANYPAQTTLPDTGEKNHSLTNLLTGWMSVAVGIILFGKAKKKRNKHSHKKMH